MEVIQDMQNYVRSRQAKGKTAREIMTDLYEHGYDQYAAHGLVMLHWREGDEQQADRFVQSLRRG